MKVFRVENTKGRGFYHDGFYSHFPPVFRWWTTLLYCSDDAIEKFISSLHPYPSTETRNLVQNDSYVYGFVCKEDLHRWFPEHIIKGIFEKGGSIKIYEVPNEFIHIDKRQCVFNINKSKYLTEYKGN